jgi:hypothetical protein
MTMDEGLTEIAEGPTLTPEQLSHWEVYMASEHRWLQRHPQASDFLRLHSATLIAVAERLAWIEDLLGLDRDEADVAVRRCRGCGCTDADCSGCIDRTGQPCHWVEADLCSACQGERPTP